MHNGVVTTESRRTQSPEWQAKPPGDYPCWDDYMADVEELERPDDDARRGLKAMQLAPSLYVCKALLDGQRVPADALDQRWRRRYGL